MLNRKMGSYSRTEKLRMTRMTHDDVPPRTPGESA
jgi:hypothetical protein